MAGYGSEYAYFAKHKTPDSKDAAPTYDAPVSLGAFVQGDLSIQNAEGEQWADNQQQEQVSKFAKATIPLQVADLPKKSAAVIYGATYREQNNAVEYGADDEPPYGAYLYIRNIIRRGVELFEANFFPKAVAARTTQASQTRSNSITFTNDTINFTVMRPLHKGTKWQYTEEFSDFDGAVKYLDSMLGLVYLTGGTAIAEEEGLAGEDLTATPIWNLPDKAPTSGISYLWQYRNAGVWTDLDDTYVGYNTDTLTTVDNQDEGVTFRCAITYNGITVYTNGVEMS